MSFFQKGILSVAMVVRGPEAEAVALALVAAS
jgi:hypothetical protein